MERCYREAGIGSACGPVRVRAAQHDKGLYGFPDHKREYGDSGSIEYLLLLIHERGVQLIGSGGRILDGLVEVVESWRLKMDS